MEPGILGVLLGGGVLTLTSQQTLEWHPQTSATGFDSLPNWTDVASALLWTSWSANPVDTDPSYVAQGTDGTVYYTDVQSLPGLVGRVPFHRLRSGRCLVQGRSLRVRHADWRDAERVGPVR